MFALCYKIGGGGWDCKGGVKEKKKGRECFLKGNFGSLVTNIPKMVFFETFFLSSDVSFGNI